MKIALLTARNSHLSGGLYNSVRCLGLSLFKKGIDLELFSYDDKYSLQDLYAYENLPMVKYTCNSLPFLKQFCYSSNLKGLLIESNPDIIHSQTLWLYMSIVTKYFKSTNRAKVVITPRGTLDSWALGNSHLKKKVARLLFENKNLELADCIHALNYSEYESIRNLGLTNPVAIIPNGINLPSNNVKRKGYKKTLLFMGRIHPKKGLSELIDALKIMKQSYPLLLESWELKIAGWDEIGHEKYLQQKVLQYELDDYVEFIGPILGQKKEQVLENSDAFVLTSFSEGLPMSILEAWAYKLPVLMTDQCNLPDGFTNKAAIRVKTIPDNIANGLYKLFSMDDSQRNTMGQNGYNLVCKDYTWSKVADKTILLYRWLLEGGDTPEFVKLD